MFYNVNNVFKHHMQQPIFDCRVGYTNN